MSDRRIAIVSDWFAPRQGGIESQLLELAERLGAAGNRVDVITSTPHARGGRHFQLRPLNVAIVPRVDVAASPRLPSALQRELGRGYDVVHAHVSVVSPVGWAGALVARRLQLPTVLTFHSVLHGKALLLRAANALMALDHSAIVWTAVSRLVATQAGAALGGADVAVLPNGIDLSFWSPGRDERPAPRWPTLVATMRLHRKKRPRALVRAFAAAARDTGNSARLLIVGEGPERAAIEDDIRRLELRDGRVVVELLGWRGMRDLRTLYREVDGFVQSSRNEAFGIAALEARAAGLPVIAMHSGSAEFLHHGRNALVCANDEELARAIGTLLTQRETRQRLAMHHDATLAAHDWPAVLAKHEACYSRAITRAAAARSSDAT